MKKDYIIILSWPETLCKQAGAWYDGISSFLKISQNNYYKVGHAAIVLINSENQTCHYFDFGRYHTPFGLGRVRNEETDHDLVIHTKAQISSKGIDNIEAILTEIKQNTSCHGDGFLSASYTKAHFNLAFQKAKQMQRKSPWRYGPFIFKGTNCSRFVRTIALAGKPKFSERTKLMFPRTISPMPNGNVKAIKQTFIIHDTNETCLNVKNIQPQTV